MSEVGRELSHKLHMTELPLRAFISQLLETIIDFDPKNDEETAFDHLSEVFEELIHCQELAAVQAALLFSGAEIMGVESQGLPSVADTVLHVGTNSSIRSVCKQGQRGRRVRVCQKCGMGEASLSVFESVDHTGCPVHRLDPVPLGPANAAWSGACVLAACGLNRR